MLSANILCENKMNILCLQWTLVSKESEIKYKGDWQWQEQSMKYSESFW